MMNDYSFLHDEFPEIISGEQLRQILHVSKRKCAWLLNNGIIPCDDNYQNSHRYAIKLDNVIAYLEDLENNPDKHNYPIGAFSSKVNKPLILPRSLPEGFREQLTYEWYDIPEVLTIADVAKITGYTTNAIDRWIVKGNLRSVLVQTGLVTCREWLIEFYCNDGYNIIKKVDRHKGLLVKLLYH